MLAITKRIDKRLHSIFEDVNTDWKSPRSANYDRAWAEDALYHTVGPLMDNPRWTERWTSKSEPVPGFVPGGPAPQWTPEEVVYAFAGDPNLLFKSKDNPRSPAYGPQGGSPLFRLARRISRQYARDRDMSFVADMYSNGFIPLVRMMQPGFDEGRSPFISFVMKNVEGAMRHGIGGTEEGIRAAGGESTSGLTGLRDVISNTNPEKVRKIADQVKGKYQTQKSHDRHPDNPFGPYSSRFYQVLNRYADALESGNEDQIDASKNHIQQLMDTIEDEATPIRGASTGMGQAVSTQDRKTSVGVASIDAERPGSEGEGTSMSANVASDDHESSWIDPESINYILAIALEHDIGAAVGHIPKYQKMAADLGGKVEANGSVKIGGRLTANELRYVIRGLGPLGSNYPGIGKMRANVRVPRDAASSKLGSWWEPGEDPEIEPIPAGGTWTSIWKRENSPQMGSTAVAQEMTEEVREFEKLGIKSARTIKAKIDSRSGKDRAEVVSKVAVNTAIKSALLKLQIIAKIHRGQLGMDESVIKALRDKNVPLLESYDAIDRRMIVEAGDYIVRRLQHMIMGVDIPILAEVAFGPGGPGVIGWKGGRGGRGGGLTTSKLIPKSGGAGMMTGSDGRCPKCGMPSVTHKDGNDTCQNGHTYPSRNAIN